MKLTTSIPFWGTVGFNDALKAEIEQLAFDQLPLQQGLSQSSYVADNGFQAIILNIAEEGGSIRAKIGFFYSGIVAGCNCADDPSPVDTLNEYCEMLFHIDPQTGDTQITLES